MGEEDGQQKQRARRRRGAWLALLFPLFFFLVIAAGIGFMYFKRMSVFRPAHGALAGAAVAGVSGAPVARDTALAPA